jgi:hypothetical protein
MLRLFLKPIANSQVGTVRVQQGQSISIGSSAAADYQVPAFGSKSCYCELSLRSGGCFLDCKSDEFHVEVNGNQVNRIRMKNGDTLRIGKVDFMVQIDQVNLDFKPPPKTDSRPQPTVAATEIQSPSPQSPAINQTIVAALPNSLANGQAASAALSSPTTTQAATETAASAAISNPADISPAAQAPVPLSTHGLNEPDLDEIAVDAKAACPPEVLSGETSQAAIATANPVEFAATSSDEVSRIKSENPRPQEGDSPKSDSPLSPSDTGSENSSPVKSDPAHLAPLAESDNSPPLDSHAQAAAIPEVAQSGKRDSDKPLVEFTVGHSLPPVDSATLPEKSEQSQPLDQDPRPKQTSSEPSTENSEAGPSTENPTKAEELASDDRGEIETGQASLSGTVNSDSQNSLPEEASNDNQPANPPQTSPVDAAAANGQLPIQQVEAEPAETLLDTAEKPRDIVPVQCRKASNYLNRYSLPTVDLPSLLGDLIVVKVTQQGFIPEFTQVSSDQLIASLVARKGSLFVVLKAGLPEFQRLVASNPQRFNFKTLNATLETAPENVVRRFFQPVSIYLLVERDDSQLLSNLSPTEFAELFPAALIDAEIRL